MAAPQCVECQREVDERRELVWHGVIGWEKKRGGGGTNHIALRTPTSDVMCNACMTRLAAGLSSLQESLL